MMLTWNQFIADPDALICVQGIPYDINSSYQRGPAEAPPLIRAAFQSPSANRWSENGINLGAKGIFVDAGDLSVESNYDMFLAIEQATSTLLDHALRPLSLGGDHAVTFPIIKAISAHHSHLSILHFDAHPDLYDHLDGNHHSHACPFARIMESGLVDRLIQIGIRTVNGHQRDQANKFGVEIIDMIHWSDSKSFDFATPLYISFDMDCLDPAYAPGVSHWEPGGFSTRQVLRIIQSLRAPIVGADIVEFNPRVEAAMTAMVAAKVFKEIAAKMLESLTHFKHVL